MGKTTPKKEKIPVGISINGKGCSVRLSGVADTEAEGHRILRDLWTNMKLLVDTALAALDQPTPTESEAPRER